MQWLLFRVRLEIDNCFRGWWHEWRKGWSKAGPMQGQMLVVMGVLIEARRNQSLRVGALCFQLPCLGSDP